MFSSPVVPEITFQDFANTYLDAPGKVARLNVHDRNKVYIYVPNGSVVACFSIGSVDIFEKQLNRAQFEAGFKPTEYISVNYTRDHIGAILSFIYPLAILGIVMYGASKGMKGGPLSGIMKSPAKLFDKGAKVYFLLLF